MEIGREKSLSGLDVREREHYTFEEMTVYWGPLVDYEGESPKDEMKLRW